jgi:transcriptional regulator with XRE-family HTH domain
MNLGNKIRELRHAGGLTQEQLAATLNVSPQAITPWSLDYVNQNLQKVTSIYGNGNEPSPE